MTLFYEREGIRLYCGDNREVLPMLEPESISAVVSDPPYGLSFMGRDWDHGVPGPHFWELMRDVLKPGAHLVAMGGTRTHHRLWVAIEDAGYEIRDTLMWIHGGPFPKSHNLHGKWEGWGTGLKPAYEPIVLARKPLSGTVAATVMAHGTGALNIDASRVAGKWTTWTRRDGTINPSAGFEAANLYGSAKTDQNVRNPEHPAGRWPPNVLMDDEAAAVLDQQSGESRSPATYRRKVAGYGKDAYGPSIGEPAGKDSLNYGDTGGASRFFPRLPVDDPDTTRFLYTAKASRKERNAGLEGMPEKFIATMGNGIGKREHDPEHPRAYAQNHHPTVKPLALMRWLLTLVTPPGGVVLDPFAGSGSTLVAAAQLGINAIGIEMDAEYCAIAAARIDHALDERARVQAAIQQASLFAQLVAD